jgi:hypothetical protein
MRGTFANWGDGSHHTLRYNNLPPMTKRALAAPLAPVKAQLRAKGQTIDTAATVEAAYAGLIARWQADSGAGRDSGHDPLRHPAFIVGVRAVESGLAAAASAIKTMRPERIKACLLAISQEAMARVLAKEPR